MMKANLLDDGFELTTLHLSTTSKPTSHQGVDSPLCKKCKELGLLFFDPECPGCYSILRHPSTTVSHIFAIIRQWMPQVQKNIGIFIEEILKRGSHVNDRDGLTDMTLLHYASKSGANGVGDAAAACDTVEALIKQGADITQKCRWTDMLPLHYATFFDVAPVMEILLESSGSADADCPCKEFENGTPLHIACSNVCYSAVKCLLAHKANPKCKNSVDRLPRQCLPDASSVEVNSDIILKIQSLLFEAETSSSSLKMEKLNVATLHALGLAIGDDVIVSGQRGILKYCGPTDFASGHWAGIALDDAVGKNDGSVSGIRYFDCKPKHGIFAPVSRIRKVAEAAISSVGQEDSNGLSSVLSKNENRKNQIGDRVLVAGQKAGIIRFIGETQFASGVWIGVELDEPHGKNDGSVSGIRYFQCTMNYGIFAPLAKIQKFIRQPFEDRLNKGENSDSQRLNKSQKNSRTVLKASFDKELTLEGREISTQKIISLRNSDVAMGKSQENQIMKQRKQNESASAFFEPFRLKPGMSVYINNELGIVRYIGNIQFSDGIWLGIELRKPVGKNDGSVGDYRYFTCKPNCGLFIRPNRATCRGINCAQLLPAS